MKPKIVAKNGGGDGSPIATNSKILKFKKSIINFLLSIS